MKAPMTLWSIIVVVLTNPRHKLDEKSREDLVGETGGERGERHTVEPHIISKAIIHLIKSCERK